MGMSQAEDQEAANEAESVAEESQASAPKSIQSEVAEETQAEVVEKSIEEAAVEEVEQVAEEKIEESVKEDSFNVEADGAITSSKNDLAEAISVAEDQVEKEISEITEPPVASVPASPTAESPNGQQAVANQDTDSAIVRAEAVNGESDEESEWVDE